MTKPYDEGLIAAWGGKELWHNPYTQYAASMVMFNAWLAGWCHGKANQPQESDTKQ